MGCDIHTSAQKKLNGEWVELDFCPFSGRCYGLFGFLADVRNYSRVPTIVKPRGLPEDTLVGYEDMDGHSHSWLSVSELLNYDYDKFFEDLRGPGRETLTKGKGVVMSLRDFLGEGYFKELKKLHESGAERIEFYFDS